MRVIANLAQEFDEMMASYTTMGGGEGKDMVILVNLFGDRYDHIRGDGIPDFGAAWAEFLDEHKHQMTVWPMTALILNILVTYWEDGQLLFQGLPHLEKMLVRDIVMEISEEQKRRSENGNSSGD